MTPNGRRAWRRAAKKLRCKMGRRWRSQKEWLFGKRWSELVPDLASHRGHISGPWFKRHGFQSLDQESSSRHYIGLWGTANGETIGFVEAAQPFTARSLVGMSMGARKRIAWREYLAWCRKNPDRELLKSATIDTWDEKGLEEGYQRGLQAQREVRTKHRIGERLRPCPGCCACKSRMLTFRELKRFFPAMAHAHPHVLRRVVEKGSWRCGSMVVNADTDPLIHRDDVHCDGSGVLPARKKP